MPDCFVIMPITTPVESVDRYQGDKNHFQHVYDCLFRPAIENAGFTPLPPKAEGSLMIHPEIIRRLNDAELVLCDISGYNPNVFFELGIRTALNKSVCMVRDSQTDAIPFDNSPIQTETYDVELAAWSLNSQVEKLTQHIKKSSEGGGNQLWRYFGISTAASGLQAEASTDEKLDLLIGEVQQLRSSASAKVPRIVHVERHIEDHEASQVISLIRAAIGEDTIGLKIRDSSSEEYDWDVLAPKVTPRLERRVKQQLAKLSGVRVRFIG